MKIAIASDHAGFKLKESIKKDLLKNGYSVFDYGTHSEEPVDYPDYAYQVAKAISENKVERGIILCGSGVGASIAANKVKGVRAAVCHDSYSAHQGVEHDDMNALVLGARIVGECLAYELVHGFLKAKFISEERFLRRLNKVKALENVD
ncbi:MAG: ribose 5-phosphate isomerase B [Myxococcales bacterium]|nr:ribose 5-phosphate isomerase B [Myxococcales bacterium]USN50053.1 MAG: ribose 5-phosphate isomerase B [Myxococcales bacterium]